MKLASATLDILVAPNPQDFYDETPFHVFRCGCGFLLVLFLYASCVIGLTSLDF